MKRALAIVLAAVLAAGCASNPQRTDQPAEPNPVGQVLLGVVLLGLIGWGISELDYDDCRYHHHDRHDHKKDRHRDCRR